MTAGQPGTDSGLTQNESAQTDSAAPQVSSNQFNQQIQLIFPSLIEALSGLADEP